MPLNFNLRAIAALLFLSLGAATAWALPVPALQGHVNDKAGVLGVEERAALEQYLAAYELKTGRQYVVLIVPSLDEDNLDDFSMRVAEAWKIGKSKKDDGLLLLIALRERKIRIEVGYGLEGEITDAQSSRVIREILQPAFRRQDFVGGIRAALVHLMGKDAPAQLLADEKMQSPRSRPAAPGFLKFILFALFILFFFIGPRFPGTGLRGGGLFLGGLGMGGGGRRGGGGGFSGGGGSFGGGGASGGW